MYHCLSLMTDDKLNDQYVVQRPSGRASRRKDEFIWYDKTSGKYIFTETKIHLLIQQLPLAWLGLLLHGKIHCTLNIFNYLHQIVGC